MPSVLHAKDQAIKGVLLAAATTTEEALVLCLEVIAAKDCGEPATFLERAPPRPAGEGDVLRDV